MITLYIAIPHQARAAQWYLTEATQPQEDDSYIDGDHDLHGILKIDTAEELRLIADSYEGHQLLKVRAIAEELLTDYRAARSPLHGQGA